MGYCSAHMLTIRLQRRGRVNDPSFRVIVVDSKRGPKSGDYLEMLGSYDPRVNRIDLEGEKIKGWIAKGAQVSDTVHNLLVSKGVIEGKKKNVLPRKSPIKKEGEEAPATPAAAAEAAPAPEAAPAETPVEAPAPEEPKAE